MFPYLIIGAIFLVSGVLLPQRNPNRYVWATAYVVLVVFIGLRHKVGMDWNNYILMAMYVDSGTVWDSFRYAEPGYSALLWLSQHLGAGVYGANLVGSAIFCAGLFRYARTTPQPWLALAVAVPILVVVIAMSANRQSIAIGILLWLCADWESKSLARRVAFVLAAAMFHFSAIFFLMFAVLGLQMSRPRKVLITALALGAMVAFLYSTGGGEYYQAQYVGRRADFGRSPGALQHVLLNGLPALGLFCGKRIREHLFPSALLRQMAWLALLLVPASLVVSAAAGRMTLFLFPVSMYALSAMPRLFEESTVRAIARTTVAAALYTVLVVWLSFANSSLAHIPYRNALTMASSELQISRGITSVTSRLGRRRSSGSRGRFDGK